MSTENKAGDAGQAAAWPGYQYAPAVASVFARANETPTDRLTARAAQLASLTGLLYGDGLDAFQSMADEHKDRLLSLVHDLSVEVRELVALSGAGGAAT